MQINIVPQHIPMFNKCFGSKKKDFVSVQKSAKKNIVGRGRSRQSPRGDRADEQRFNGDLMGFNGDLMVM